MCHDKAEGIKDSMKDKKFTELPKSKEFGLGFYYFLPDT